jgi:hypothetical protein
VKTASADTGKQFHYQIVSGNATSYAATGLPAGLSLDSSTGLIAGIPQVGGTFPVALRAINVAGTVSAELTLKVIPLVTLKATIPKVTAGTGAKGKFTLTLSAAHREEITVHYQIEGDAINGIDYDKLSGTAKFKPGKLKRPLYIVPKGDLEGMEEKTVRIKLKANPEYSVETKTSQKVEIVAGE